MTLLDSLLDAIVRLDGDSLVMHVGEKPYVVTMSSAMNALRGPLAWGQVELSSRPLTPDAVLGMLGQILPLDLRQLLDEVGAIEHELKSHVPGGPDFILTAARGGDDVWVEVRRKPEPEPVAEPEPIPEPATEPVAEPEIVAEEAPAPVAEPEVAAGAEAPSEPVVDAPIEVPLEAVATEPALEETAEEVPAEPEFEIVAEEPQVEVGPDDVHGIEMPAGFEWVSDETEGDHEIVLNLDDHEEEVVHLDFPEPQVQAPIPTEPAAVVAPVEPATELVAEAPAIEIAAAEESHEEEHVLEITAEEPAIEPEVAEPVVEIAAAEPAVEVPAPEPVVEIAAATPVVEVAAAEPPVEVPAPEPVVEIAAAEPVVEVAAAEPVAEVPAAEPVVEIAAAAPVVEVAAVEPVVEIPAPEPVVEIAATAPVVEVAAVEPAVEVPAPEPVEQLAAPEPVAAPIAEAPPPPRPIAVVQPPAPAPVPEAAAPIDAPRPERAERVDVPPVVPIARPPLKLTPPPPAAAAPAASTEASLVGLLKAAAARGASTLYAVADSRPMVRVDGQIAVLGVEASVTAAEVDRFTFEFAPRNQVAEPASEWTCTVKGVGRVRCVTFHDDSGTGVIFHLPSTDVSTADELGLSARIQALCGEADGLVVIAGPRGSGKSTLLDAFVDLINRTRSDHVITIESHIRTAHEKRHSFISQRQSAPDGEAIAAAARAALREGPDVLVIEDLRAPEALSVALDAARAGRLVFGGIAAPTASAAVERLVGAFRADRRPQVRALLAGSLRAVIAQTLVRKPAGGRIAARELLLNSPAVERLILDGAFSQLPIAIDGGRQLGMVTMNDALGALVRDGAVDVNDACRTAPDRASLIAALERDGIDVSTVERWA